MNKLTPLLMIFVLCGCDNHKVQLPKCEYTSSSGEKFVISTSFLYFSDCEKFIQKQQELLKAQKGK